MDSHELRAPLAETFDRFTSDLTTGRHGDPHLAFAILIYPDREPAVVALDPPSPYDLTDLRRSENDDGRPFPWQEFQEAHNAMSDAELGIIIGQGGGYLGATEIGDAVRERIRGQWDRRRLAPIEAALASADYEAAHPAQCEQCKRRFTQRGLKMHLARSRFCEEGGTVTRRLGA